MTWSIHGRINYSKALKGDLLEKNNAEDLRAPTQRAFDRFSWIRISFARHRIRDTVADAAGLLNDFLCR